MPDGYRVTLGADQTLGSEDSIGLVWTNFTTAQSLGTGEWAFTGIAGIQYRNETEPGEYFLATDGNVYFVPDFGIVPTMQSAMAVTVPDYSELNIVNGTGSADNIDGTFTDSGGDGVDDGDGSPAANSDLVFGEAGNDTILSGAAADTVYGGSGDDSINGGGGGDTLYGDSEPGSTESMNWFFEGVDGQSLAAGFTQNTGDMDVTVSFTNTGNNNPTYTLQTRSEQIYVESGEEFSDRSNLFLFGNGDGSTARVTLEFSAAANADVSDEVANVRFRISDVDFAAGNHRDVLSFTDSAGNPLDVTITVFDTGVPLNNDTVSGSTVTAGNAGGSAATDSGSILVEVAGPVGTINIDYSNALSGTQGVNISDVYFETIPNADGNDTIQGGGGQDTIFGQGGDDVIAGGTGADLVFGGAGNDTISVAQGDTVDGGAGDDLFRLVDLAESGASNITLVGGEDDETLGDILDIGGIADRTTLNLTTNTPGELAGSIELADGSLVTFSNIEQIICFTPGAMIDTPHGPRLINTLKVGDLVLTRDNGPQPIRWIGQREVAATGSRAPIEIDPVLVPGATAPLLVSPQHRMLWTGYRAQLLFGETEILVAAKHLLGNPAVRQLKSETITYIHMMFDRHEIVFANGMPTESFFPGSDALEAVTDESRRELFRTFPGLRSNPGAFGDTARLCLRAHEAPALFA